MTKLVDSLNDDELKRALRIKTGGFGGDIAMSLNADREGRYEVFHAKKSMGYVQPVWDNSTQNWLATFVLEKGNSTHQSPGDDSMLAIKRVIVKAMHGNYVTV